MTVLALDTEFNGFGGDLMSLGIVADDGRQFYEVCPQPSQYADWVLENVVPHLGKEPCASLEEFRGKFLEFMRGFNNPTIVVDWYTDAAHFFSLFAGNDHTQSFDYPCVLRLVSIDTPSSEVPHNALHDAKAILRAYMGD